LQHQVRTAAARSGGFLFGRQVPKTGAIAVLSTTDDLRINEIRELSTPQEIMREIPRTLTATRVVTATQRYPRYS
jgi:hypothetical protein